MACAATIRSDGSQATVARRLGWLLVPLLALAALLAPQAARAENPVVIENQQPGESTLWQWWNDPSIVGRANDTAKQIKGYASAVSVNKGSSITFHVTVTPAQTYKMKIYRMGWYRGARGRYMTISPTIAGTTQADCPTDPTTGMIECNWTPGWTLTVPTTWTSGIYVALLINQQGYANYVPFVVRDDARSADLLFQQSVTTYQAYNGYPNDGKTGKSLYPSNSYGATTITGTKRAVKVSFDRPYPDNGIGQFMEWEIQFVQWAERSGYDIAYSTDVDTHAAGSRLLNYRAFLSVGHDEYWSKAMYDATRGALSAGVDLGFFGSNDIYWQVRFEPSSRGVPNRVMVCYKDASLDPVKGDGATVTFRDLGRPEQGVLGVQQTSVIAGGFGGQYAPYVVTNSGHWVYEGTGFRDGDSVPGLVGYEADRVMAGFPSPAGVTLLSNSPYAALGGGSDYSNSAIYESAGGGWVFAAGTMGWAFGLNNWNQRNLADARIQRTTANILARFINGNPTTP